MIIISDDKNNSSDKLSEIIESTINTYDLSLRSVAKEIDVGSSTLSGIINNKAEPKLTTLEKLSTKKEFPSLLEMLELATEKDIINDHINNLVNGNNLKDLWKLLLTLNLKAEIIDNQHELSSITLKFSLANADTRNIKKVTPFLSDFEISQSNNWNFTFLNKDNFHIHCDKSLKLLLGALLMNDLSDNDCFVLTTNSKSVFRCLNRLDNKLSNKLRVYSLYLPNISSDSSKFNSIKFKYLSNQ